MPYLRPIIIWGLSTTLASLAAACLPQVGSSTVNFGTDGRPTICIPRSEIPDFLRNKYETSLWLDKAGVSEPEVIVHYGGNTVRKAVPAFHFQFGYKDVESPNVLDAQVYFTERNVQLGEAVGPEALRIWNRETTCKDPIISSIGGGAFFLGQCNLGSGEQILFNRFPRVSAISLNPYQYVVGNCFAVRIGFGIHERSRLNNCTRRFYSRGFRIDYQIQLENVPNIPALDVFLASRIEEREANCRLG